MSRIILLTGPSGSGKSTIGTQIAQMSDGTWAFVEQDKIREYIKAGLKSPADHPWTTEMYDQWQVSIQICADMARRYQTRNINCVIECFAWASAHSEWHEAFDGLMYELFVLYPDLEQTMKRNGTRHGSFKLENSLIQEMHDRMAKWSDIPEATVIDTSDMSITATAQYILEK
jgi:2-phosphoglycerate kinase